MGRSASFALVVGQILNVNGTERKLGEDDE